MDGPGAGPSRASKKQVAQAQASNQENLGISTSATGPIPGSQPAKKRRHRGGRKRKNRRQSFAAPSETSEATESHAQRPDLFDVPEEVVRSAPFQRISRRRNSDDSLESEALLDHRRIEEARARRPSIIQHQSASKQSQSRGMGSSYQRVTGSSPVYTRSNRIHDQASWKEPRSHESEEEGEIGETVPLTKKISPGHKRAGGYGAVHESQDHRRPSVASSQSTSRLRRPLISRQLSYDSNPDYDVNNPPSQPGSPRLGPEDDFDEVLLPHFNASASPNMQRNLHGRETIIDIDGDGFDAEAGGLPSNTPRRPPVDVEDVCLPFDRMTEAGEEDFMHQEGDMEAQPVRRSRKRPWPDLAALEEWAQDEKEMRTMEGIKAKKVSEPELVGGRLRPIRQVWRREEEDAPFRWTYFNEDLDSSLRSHTISGLQQLGMSFRELFIPDPPLLDDSSDDEDDDDISVAPTGTETPVNGFSRNVTRQPSILSQPPRPDLARVSSGEQTGRSTPVREDHGLKPKRYGPRPVFWLDVLQPTYDEMRVICRAFGIHKLTAEDIMEQEAREKVELFRNYYFVNYRTFEQDSNSDEYMDPINMYFVVFKGGVISFHFSQMPHPPNVRRRVRQLAEHQYTDSDWIAYAIIDNITDAYAPIVEQIEREVDDIDDEILRLHSKDDPDDDEEPYRDEPREKSWPAKKLLRTSSHNDNKSNAGDTAPTSGEQSRDILLRVGECRKKVMGLYRLLGNKADVIKGLAKRCNEQWQVAPRSDVGLYLGDIQDHIVTMTGNLTHYENILSRAHSNYLAQINIRMNERAEQTNDVLGKLTVLGTIVLPMNIITGMFGSNFKVPGQDIDNLNWFWATTAGLAVFGFACFLIAKRVYRVV